MYLIVGLGNPGKQYEKTRHNAGFLVMDRLASKLGVKIGNIKFKSLIKEERLLGGRRALLMKPQTFMNLSGEAVMAAMNYYRIPPEKLIVVYDDKDTEFGQIRLRFKGSAGSHNGLKNIIYLLETDVFPRIRVGIGQKTGANLADYVLSSFSAEEWNALDSVLDRAADAVVAIVDKGIDSAMNEFNRVPE
ncbi:MAG: aminoacyl-tRNA hydrolase [Bacillota bacterium]|nr:aminoacyl-tRNA hydrolase [Bacillota bacterium]